MKEVGAATQCLTDTFTVTNPSGLTPPSICGLNTNSHSKFVLIVHRSVSSLHEVERVACFIILTKVNNV